MSSAPGPGPLRGLATLLLLATPLTAIATRAGPAGPLERCLEERGFPRVARVLGPDGRAVYARVVAEAGGVPTALTPLADQDLDLGAVFELASQPGRARQAEAWEIADGEHPARVCAPVRLRQAEIDAEQRVVVAAGLNYAAHAQEAGGGDVFLFPKPVAPTPPYTDLVPPDGVTLLDYEVELGFVLLADVDLHELPSREEFLAQAAFFVANDVSDREPIIRHKAWTGPGTGFVEGKGQPGFLPLGPWMVRGTELFGAMAACSAEGLGIRLAVDEGDGFRTRQDASTALMILDPLALLARIADEIERVGLRTAMPVDRNGQPRHYPLAVDSGPGSERDTEGPRLPAGSLVLTGTPDGVAIQAPSPLAVTARGILRLRSPFEQFRREELERAASGQAGGYLEPGDRMRAGIDGLGTQIIRITGPGSTGRPDPCEGP